MNVAAQQEEVVFDTARRLTHPVQRKAYLDEACINTPELRVRIEELLAAQGDAEQFFAESVSGLRFREEISQSSTDSHVPEDALRAGLRFDLQTGAAAWIYAGGAHHTGFSQSVTTEMLEDFAAMAGIELMVIDADTKLRQFKQELNWNEVYYGLKGGFVS